MTLVTSTPFTIENFKELFNVDSIEIISMELSNGEAPEFAYKISLIWPKRGPGFNPMKILGNENIKSMIVE